VVVLQTAINIISYHHHSLLHSSLADSQRGPH